MASYQDFQARRQAMANPAAFMNPRPVSAVPAVMGQMPTTGMTASTQTLAGTAGPQPVAPQPPGVTAATADPFADIYGDPAKESALLPDGSVMSTDGAEFALPKPFARRQFGELFQPYEVAVNRGNQMFAPQETVVDPTAGQGMMQQPAVEEEPPFDPYGYVAQQNAAAQYQQPVDPREQRRQQLMAQMFPRATAMRQRLMQARMTPAPTKNPQPPQLRRG
jgi:hypothetical protein